MFLRLLSTSLLAPLTSMLRTSSSTDSSISATQIVVDYDGVDGGGGRSGDFDRKFHPSYNSRTTHLDAQDELTN